MKYNLVSNDGWSNITAFIDGEVYTADSEHPKFAEIVSNCVANNEDVKNLFSLEKAVSAKFEYLSDRVSVKEGQVYFDLEPIHGVLTDQIVRFIEEDQDFKPLVNFLEKISDNPEQHSREQLYRWLSSNNFTITSSGDFVGYKGVKKEGDNYFSLSSGHAISNGVEFNGYIPNEIGSVVEMPRSEVEHDPTAACSYGLHVGTFGYAKLYTRNGVMLECHVNPRDVVSVPDDANNQKLRTCRYKVVNIIEEAYTESLVPSYDDYPDYSKDYCDDYEYEYDCNDCGYCFRCDSFGK